MSSYRANPVFQAMAQVCDDNGLLYQVEVGKKHCKMVVDIAGKPAISTFSVSPSDWRAPRIARSLVRRRIRENEAGNRSGIGRRANGQGSA